MNRNPFKKLQDKMICTRHRNSTYVFGYIYINININIYMYLLSLNTWLVVPVFARFI